MGERLASAPDAGGAVSSSAPAAAVFRDAAGRTACVARLRELPAAGGGRATLWVLGGGRELEAAGARPLGRWSELAPAVSAAGEGAVPALVYVEVATLRAPVGAERERARRLLDVESEAAVWGARVIFGFDRARLGAEAIVGALRLCGTVARQVEGLAASGEPQVQVLEPAPAGGAGSDALDAHFARLASRGGAREEAPADGAELGRAYLVHEISNPAAAVVVNLTVLKELLAADSLREGLDEETLARVGRSLEESRVGMQRISQALRPIQQRQRGDGANGAGAAHAANGTHGTNGTSGTHGVNGARGHDALDGRHGPTSNGAAAGGGVFASLVPKLGAGGPAANGEAPISGTHAAPGGAPPHAPAPRPPAPPAYGRVPPLAPSPGRVPPAVGQALDADARTALEAGVARLRSACILAFGEPAANRLETAVRHETRAGVESDSPRATTATLARLVAAWSEALARAAAAAHAERLLRDAGFGR